MFVSGGRLAFSPGLRSPSAMQKPAPAAATEPSFSDYEVLHQVAVELAAKGGFPVEQMLEKIPAWREELGWQPSLASFFDLTQSDDFWKYMHLHPVVKMMIKRSVQEHYMRHQPPFGPPPAYEVRPLVEEAARGLGATPAQAAIWVSRLGWIPSLEAFKDLLGPENWSYLPLPLPICLALARKLGVWPVRLQPPDLEAVKDAPSVKNPKKRLQDEHKVAERASADDMADDLGVQFAEDKSSSSEESQASGDAEAGEEGSASNDGRQGDKTGRACTSPPERERRAEEQSQAVILRLTHHAPVRLAWTEKQHGHSAASVRALVASGKLPGRSELAVYTRWHRHARHLAQDSGGSGQQGGGESKRAQASGQPATPVKRAKHQPSLEDRVLAACAAGALADEEGVRWRELDAALLNKALVEALNASHDSPDDVGLLIDHGADPNSRMPSGKTQLNVAISLGREEIACYLIEHGASPVLANKGVGDKDMWENTPLHTALYHDLPNVVRLLLTYGAKPSVLNAVGQTPERYAGEHRTSTAKSLCYVQLAATYRSATPAACSLWKGPRVLAVVCEYRQGKVAGPESKSLFVVTKGSKVQPEETGRLYLHLSARNELKGGTLANDLLLFSEDDVTHFVSCTEEPLEKSALPLTTAFELSRALLRGSIDEMGSPLSVGHLLPDGKRDLFLRLVAAVSEQEEEDEKEGRAADVTTLKHDRHLAYGEIRWLAIVAVCAMLKDTDHFLDLGSGRGLVILAAAAIAGCKASGIEVEEKWHGFATRLLGRLPELSKLVTFVRADFTHESVDLSFASAVWINNINFDYYSEKVMPRLQTLRPGTRVIAPKKLGFDPHEWQSGHAPEVRGKPSELIAYGQRCDRSPSNIDKLTLYNYTRRTPTLNKVKSEKTEVPGDTPQVIDGEKIADGAADPVEGKLEEVPQVKEDAIATIMKVLRVGKRQATELFAQSTLPLDELLDFLLASQGE